MADTKPSGSVPKPGMYRYTFDMPDELRRRINIEAARRDIKFRDCVVELLGEAVTRAEGKTPKAK